MKRKSVIAMCMCVVLLLSSCGKDNDESRERRAKRVTDQSTVTEDSSDVDTIATKKDYVNNTPRIPRDQLPYSGTEYTFEDISIIIPDSWDGKYTITENDKNHYFTVVQNASYNVDGSGLLFCIRRTENMDFLNNGSVIAYTPEYVYTIEFPSDVNYVYDDDQISAEYMEMFKDINVMTYSLYIAEGDVNYKTNEYILPGSEYFVYDSDLLCDYTYNDLILAEQELFARNGKIFTNDPEAGYFLQSYFEGKTWYKGQKNDVSIDDLSDIEKTNYENITQKIEDKKADARYCQILYLDEHMSMDVDCDDIDEDISYYSAGPEYDGDLYIHPMISIDGTEYDLGDYPHYEEYFDDCADHCFIVDLNPYNSVYAIAIPDYGPSDDLVTHFFVVKGDELINAGCIPGFFIQPDSYLSGFSDYGSSVIGEKRVDIPETSWVYAHYYYDDDNYRFEESECQYQYVLSSGHELLQDVTVSLPNDDKDYTYTFKKGEKVYYTATDIDSYLEVKNENDVVGYIYIGKNDNYQDVDINTGTPLTEIFEGLMFVD